MGLRTAAGTGVALKTLGTTSVGCDLKLDDLVALRKLNPIGTVAGFFGTAFSSSAFINTFLLTGFA